MNITIILGQLVSFFLMLLAGYAAARFHVLSEEHLSGLSGLITKILLPVLIFANAMNGPTRAQLFGSSSILLLAIGMYAALILLFFLLARALRISGERSRIFQAAFIFGNGGFLGIPLLTALFPENGPIYVVLLSIVDQALLWTYGLYLCSADHKSGGFSVKNFLNPALVSIFLSIVCLLVDVRPPQVVESALLTIGRAATPISLIYLGGLLCYCHWQETLRSKELYVGVVVKMLIFPVLFHVVIGAIGLAGDMGDSMTLIAALPSMTTVAIFSKSRSHEGSYALGLVLLTTVVSLLTLACVSFAVF